LVSIQERYEQARIIFRIGAFCSSYSLTFQNHCQQKTDIIEPEEVGDAGESSAKMIFGCFKLGLFR